MAQTTAPASNQPAAAASAPAPKPPAPIAKEAPDATAWRIALSGTWELAEPGSDEFKPIPVPSYWGKGLADPKKAGDLLTATYRREFTLPAGRAGGTLEFDSIRWGGEVLVNGASAGKHDLGYSGAAFDISKQARPGANRLEVKPVGWKAIQRYPGGQQYIPIGAGNWFGMKQGGIPGDVFLYLHDAARLEQFRVYPRIAMPGCDLSVPVQASEKGFAGVLAVQILSDDGQVAWSAARRVPVELKAGERQVIEIKDVAIPGGPLWSPASPTLLRACLWLERDKAGGPPAAVRDDTFGLREVQVRKGRFLLNGKPMALHGVSGVWVYNDFDLMANTELIRAFQVTRFRQMNAVIFRGHQDPLPRKWIDMCDRNGILIACEFNNFPDVQIQPSGTINSPYDQQEYSKNLLREAEGLIRDRFNRPSIVLWSASNEGNGFGEWERANLVPFVKKQDPTRLVMLSSDITPDIADQHNFCGNWWGAAGDFERVVGQLAKAYPDRLYGCTEYSQYQGNSARWYGPKAQEKDRAQIGRDAAQLLLEQTETLRRLRCGVIMPFNVPIGRAAEWQPGESFFALRNALAPMAVSINFPSRHALAGGTIRVPVWVMSDAESAAGDVSVRLVLLDKHPGYGWEGKADGLNVLASQEFRASLAPWQAIQKDVDVKLPDRPGELTLAAVLVREGQTPVASLRPLKVYAALPPAPKPLKVAVLDEGENLTRWLKARGHEVIPLLAADRPDVVIIGERMLNDSTIRQYQFTVVRRVNDGSRLIVLEQGAWNPGIMDGKALEQLQTASPRGAVQTLFPHEQYEGLLGPAADYERLNGLENAAMRVSLESAPSLAAAKRLSLQLTGTVTTRTTAPAASAPAEVNPWTALLTGYSRGLGSPDIALAYRTFGKGDIFACQIMLTPRILGGDAQNHDPVAERLLALLVEGKLTK